LRFRQVRHEHSFAASNSWLLNVFGRAKLVA
jgi:hypothetical protein